MPIPLGILAAAGASGGASYWLGFINDQDTTDVYIFRGRTSGTDIYAFGYSSNASWGFDTYLLKLNAAGAIQWQKRFGQVSSTEAHYFLDGILDSNSNPIGIGRFGGVSAAGGVNVAGLLKYDSSGTLQNQIANYGTSNTDGYGISKDSSDNLYVISEDDANSDLFIYKMNSSLAIQWDIRYGSSALDMEPKIVYDNVNSAIYIITITFIGDTDGEIGIARLNSDGTTNWVRKLASTLADYVRDVAVDSVGDVYGVGWTDGTGTAGAILFKYNSSGTLQWQRRIHTTSLQFEAIHIDSNDNIYIVGRGLNDACQILKYNASGTVQWQRRWDHATLRLDGKSIVTDANGDVIIFAESTNSTTYPQMIAKVPADGSKTGTYSVLGENWVYQASTLAEAAATLTSSTPTFTRTDITLNQITTTFTDNTENNTFTSVTL